LADDIGQEGNHTLDSSSGAAAQNIIVISGIESIMNFMDELVRRAHREAALMDEKVDRRLDARAWIDHVPLSCARHVAAQHIGALPCVPAVHVTLMPHVLHDVVYRHVEY
jgi:hypothetical protein